MEIVASVFARFAELALYIAFWSIISHYGAVSISFQDILSYYLIATGLTPLFNLAFGVGGMMIDHIKTGQLSHALIRPTNPILYPWATRIGRNLINYMFGIAQVAAGIALGGGIGLDALPHLLPVLMNAVLINVAFNIFIGTMGFHLTDARGFKNAFLHTASFARGERIPLYLMTPGLAAFLSLTPFPASHYHLAIVLQGTRLPAWGDVVIGMVWGILLIGAALLFWRRSLKKYEAVGL